MASSKDMGGRMDGMRRASMVLPEPGGPIIKRLCASGGGHLQCSLGVLLPLHLGKIVAVSALAEQLLDSAVAGNDAGVLR